MNRGISVILVLAALLSAASVAHATKTYTPAQLRQMVNSGSPPAQGSPTTQKETMAFSSCVGKVAGIVAAVGDQYPARTIVNTSIMHVAKVWTNDAAMTLTCSSPDRTLVITTAKYR